jgi:hypothetical protein
VPQSATVASITLPVGTTTLATLVPDVTDTFFSLRIDRTVALGLNATVGPNIFAFGCGVDYSPDGGTTWNSNVGMTCPGLTPGSPGLSGVAGSISPSGDPSPTIRCWFKVPNGVTTLVVAGTLATS